MIRSRPLKICIGPTIRIGRESWCLPYAGFFLYAHNSSFLSLRLKGKKKYLGTKLLRQSEYLSNQCFKTLRVKSGQVGASISLLKDKLVIIANVKQIPVLHSCPGAHFSFYSLSLVLGWPDEILNMTAGRQFN